MLSHNKSTSETRTTSILQRLPLILAVTAASYGLALHVQQQVHRDSTQQQQAERR